MMNLSDFKQLKSKSEKKKYLLKYFDIKEPILIGSIGNKIDGKLWINNIHSIDGEYILNNPFNELEQLSVSLNTREEKLDLNTGDKVYFMFDINRYDDILEKYPIVTQAKNIDKLVNIDDSDLSLKEKIIERLKKNNIRNNTEKLLIKADIEKELIEIIDDNQNLLDKQKRQYEDELILIKQKHEEELKVLESKKQSECKKKDDIIKKINKITEELKEKEELKKSFEEYGFSFDIEKAVNLVSGKTNVKKDKHINYIQKYLAYRPEKKLYYSKEILEQFYGGLCTNQLVILSGQPGTGKTSLVEGFCNAIGAKLNIISVQPNWTDNQDLLGFFNPIENTYISTPFLDGIIEAKNNPDRLYVICLDEMNLAHVEYYFSEFLSKMQSEEKNITLYSDYLYKQAKEEVISKIEFFIGKRNENSSDIDKNIEALKNTNMEECYKLKKQWNSLQRYKNEIKLPSNIRFVGTINKDETTKNLSPKVIDRSYIMEIDVYDEALEEALSKVTEAEKKKYKDNLYLTEGYFERKSEKISDNLLQSLNEVELILKKLNITLSNRIKQQIKELYGAEIISDNNIFDTIVTTKILPKISLEVESDNEKLIEEFESKLVDTIISKKIFLNMKSYWKQSEILTFWR